MTQREREQDRAREWVGVAGAVAESGACPSTSSLFFKFSAVKRPLSLPRLGFIISTMPPIFLLFASLRTLRPLFLGWPNNNESGGHDRWCLWCEHVLPPYPSANLLVFVSFFNPYLGFDWRVFFLWYLFEGGLHHSLVRKAIW